MISAILFGLATASMAGYTIYDNRRLDRVAKKNEEANREEALQRINNSGMNIDDFPKYEDALRGKRYLKYNEVIDIHYRCSLRRNG